MLKQYCTSSTSSNYYEALGEILPDSIFENKTIVACGQSTHGSKENFQIQAELFKRLVKNEGCRTFVMEANYSSLLLVNDYVNGGINSKEEVMRSLDFWTWDTEEVWELIEWIREFNQSMTNDKPILFLGNDIQKVNLSAKGVLGYFQRFGGGYSDSALKLLSPLVYDTSRVFMLRNSEGDSLFQTEMEKLEYWAEQIEIPTGSDRETYILTKYNLVILRQALELASSGSNYGQQYRDSAMASNVRHVLQLDLRNGVMYIWAHNYHIGNITQYADRMGAYLSKWYGEQFVCLAVDFSCEGSFIARQPIADSLGPKTEYTNFSKPMECSIVSDTNSLGYKCGQRESGLTFFNSGSAALDTSLTNAPIFYRARMHTIGAIFDPNIAPSDRDYLYSVDLSREFDGIIFYGKSTPTIQLNTPKNPSVRK